MLRTAFTRSVRSSPSSILAARPAAVVFTTTQQRFATAHAISNPTLADIEKRWEAMPPQEQADLWMALRDRMKTNWSELTLQEKKAAYWIAFGAHGPRALPPPGEGWQVAAYTALGVGISFALFFGIRMFARGPPETMTKEYQLATDEYLRGQNADPISGVSAEGSKVTNVQSAPKKN